MRLVLCLVFSAVVHGLLLGIAATKIVTPNLSISFLQEGSVLTVKTVMRKPITARTEAPPAPPIKQNNVDEQPKQDVIQEPKRKAPMPSKLKDIEKRDAQVKPTVEAQAPSLPENKALYQSLPTEEPRLIDITEYRSNPPPRYPERARRRHQEGTVYLLVTVDASGVVMEATIKESSGHSVLDEAAKEAVSSWRFSSAPEWSTTATNRVIVPILFRLTK